MLNAAPPLASQALAAAQPAGAPAGPGAAPSARDSGLCDAILAALWQAASARPAAAQAGGGAAAVAEQEEGDAGAAARRDPASAALSLCELALAFGRGAADCLLQRALALLKVRRRGYPGSVCLGLGPGL